MKGGSRLAVDGLTSEGSGAPGSRGLRLHDSGVDSECSGFKAQALVWDFGG